MQNLGNGKHGYVGFPLVQVLEIAEPLFSEAVKDSSCQSVRSKASYTSDLYRVFTLGTLRFIHDSFGHPLGFEKSVKKEIKLLYWAVIYHTSRRLSLRILSSIATRSTDPA